MKTIFGVNSVTPINKKLKNGHTMYDWVVRKNCYPAFCMRTLTGDNKIIPEEIEFLKAKGCKIGLVFNDLTEKEVSAISGVLSAERAVNAALELGVPVNTGIVLFAEIKPEWSVNHNWMISFASTLRAKGFVAGFIGNTDSSKNFNFDRQTGHFVKATKDMNCFAAANFRPQTKSASSAYSIFSSPVSLNFNSTFFVIFDIFIYKILSIYHTKPLRLTNI